MKAINLILPNQLYKHSPLLENGLEIYLIEEYLYFQHYQFHKQKIAFHRASMKAYQFYLEGLGKKVKYIESENEISDIRNFTIEVKEKEIGEIHVIDLTDFWLEKRLSKLTSYCKLTVYPDQQFLNTKQDLYPFFRSDKKSFFQTSFYKQQRKKRNILVDDMQQPHGGKWTFDAENRKKYPKDKQLSLIHI